MPIVPNRYRGTKEYALTQAELISAARHRGLITYQDVAIIIGIKPIGSHMGNVIGHLLGELSEDEHRLGRPMLSAICVSVKGTPGPGFYELAKRLEKFHGTGRPEENRFWEVEKKAVYAEWQPTKMALSR